eukprot:CAMPEP_0172443772 /NCGR_PEP_ID=MMETSP1065-20121228/3984_1 /TAXON_ID=265537 /ORGANISM="Amphiprora paludosa, Strain CCMP125" /LENGTH=135 /DNA_ID=CAMNT_0013194109 /DNA_START=107 /DNA_END=514 /DNA_ORIENTATION=-
MIRSSRALTGVATTITPTLWKTPTCRTPLLAHTSTRFLSTTPSSPEDPVIKLRTVLEEYRQEHYAQCMPMRFKKELIAVATEKSPSQNVRVEGLEHLLTNIGKQDRVTSGDLQAIFQQNGNESGEIPPQQFMRLF